MFSILFGICSFLILVLIILLHILIMSFSFSLLFVLFDPLSFTFGDPFSMFVFICTCIFNDKSQCFHFVFVFLTFHFLLQALFFSCPCMFFPFSTHVPYGQFF